VQADVKDLLPIKQYFAARKQIVSILRTSSRKCVIGIQQSGVDESHVKIDAVKTVVLWNIDVLQNLDDQLLSNHEQRQSQGWKQKPSFSPSVRESRTKSSCVNSSRRFHTLLVTTHSVPSDLEPDFWTFASLGLHKGQVLEAEILAQIQRTRVMFNQMAHENIPSERIDDQPPTCTFCVMTKALRKHRE
jgi:hypothetical protein